MLQPRFSSCQTGIHSIYHCYCLWLKMNRLVFVQLREARSWYNWLWLTVLLSSGHCVLVCTTWRKDESVLNVFSLKRPVSPWNNFGHWEGERDGESVEAAGTEKSSADFCPSLLLFSHRVFSICLQTWQWCWDGSEREVVITLEWQCFDVSETRSSMGSLHLPHTWHEWFDAFSDCFFSFFLDQLITQKIYVENANTLIWQDYFIKHV